MAAAPPPGDPQPPPGAAVDGRESPVCLLNSLHIKPPISSPPPPILSPEGMECFGNERSVLTEQAKFYDNPLLSDVTLRVGDEIFHGHKLILVRASEVFERMLSSEWSDPRLKELKLVEDDACIEVFPRFLRFLYGCHITLNSENALPVLVLADKYNVSDLRQVCINFTCDYIIPKLQLKDVFHVWFQYATKCYHTKLINACIMALADKMDDICSSLEWEQEWLNMDEDQLIHFLQSSELVIKDEYSLWKAVLKWLQSSIHESRQAHQEALLTKLLAYIRFPMMTPDQLCELEKNKLVEQYRPNVMPYLTTAYKFHALSLASRAALSKEFSSTSFLLRNYTELRWDRRITIRNYSQLHRCCEVVVRLNTRSSSFPSQNWDWELKVFPKGYSSSNEDFRCLLYSNVILDQPRAVEFMLSVVDDARILRTVTGQKNFTKARYTADTEIDKKVYLHELLEKDSHLLVNDTLVLQLALRPVE